MERAPSSLSALAALFVKLSVGRENTRGYSLMECLVALGLTALSSALALQLLKQSCSQLSGATATIEQRLATVKSATIISSSLSALERSHLPQLIWITNGANPKTPSGEAHPVIGLAGTSKPRPESDILSAIEIDPYYQGRIVETRISSQSVSVTICESQSIPAKDQFRSHLLLSAGGLCQITGTPEMLSRGCFSVNGAPVRGLINQGTRCSRNAYLEYRPVSREISLLIDRSSEFRLISHVGMRLIENQPITRGLRELKIQRISPRIDAQFFRIMLRTSAAKWESFLIPAALTSEAHWNELLL